MATFETGQRVRAMETAQGMERGEILTVVEIDERWLPFGVFVAYRLERPDGGDLWVRNGHLLLQKA